jgi:hypothetical protein
MAEAAGLEPAHAMRVDLANRCHTIRRRLQKEFYSVSDGFGGRLGSRTLHGLSRHSFQDCLTHSTVGPSIKTWLGRPDLNRESRAWNPMVCRLAYAPKNLGACGKTRTYEVVRRLISKDGAFAAQLHMRVRSQISNSRFHMILNLRSICVKKIDEGRE